MLGEARFCSTCQNHQDKNAVTILKDGDVIAHVSRILASIFVKRIRYFDFNTVFLNRNCRVTLAKL